MNFEIFKFYKENMKIDYFSYFIKCYLALNAYLQTKYKSGNDREKIDNLKDEEIVCKRFMELLGNEYFLNTLKSLQQSLYGAQIGGENIISFENVKIQSFQNKQINEKINRITFKLQILAGKNERVKFICINTKSETIADKTCQYSNLEQELNNTILSKTQRDTVKSLFQKEISQYHKNLIAIINQNDIKDEDKKIIYKGFIEIVYLLRNSLFHSQVDPSQENIYNVYKTAYMLLKDFINKLPIEE
ncbi:hypothetical protein [Campylobacter jejuni]|uniref:hypothetical protein n=1 Tax=Campylobacter jejuni TaxID=197 RepID=UPI000873DEFB|nr:hypothetical protein [Campylobacter jejuni]OEX75402.1 hypothetical protein A0K63_09730 [Campylobacter jejuni]OKY00047.1 hypothetical protein A0K62_02840 [Campylobacter jejuni]HEB9279573.1 hypothetical protein [Campylobacter jejuni]